MKKTIIYVFGPRRLADIYFSDNKPMNLDFGGWLKIGQTATSDSNQDVRSCALNRIRQESKTGIPEVCQLFDIFEYPEISGNTDDRVRDILTDEVYKLDSSKKQNSDKEKYAEIKAGREFVYGVTRKQVLNAIARFERDIILHHYGKDAFDLLMECVKNNAKNLSRDDMESEGNGTENNETAQWTDGLWEDVKNRICSSSPQIGKISIPKGRPYFFINSAKYKDKLFYTIKYSIRKGMASVSVETDKGNAVKEEIESIISTKPENNELKEIKAIPGVKSDKKWEWPLSTSINKSYDELVQWYVDTILSTIRFVEY